MKIRVGVFFGGESVEHEISIISANQAMHAMDQTKYEVIPVYISKDRLWYTGDALFDIKNYQNMNELKKQLQRANLAIRNKVVVLEAYPAKFFSKSPIAIDLAFPVIHGTNGEDGSLQGVFEMFGLPYVGCDVKAAAVGQDKIFMKQILRDSGLPIPEYTWFYQSDYHKDQKAIFKQIKPLGFPLVIKPASLGSSVGISFAKNQEELIQGIEEAMRYDQKIVVEEAIQNLTEINCSVLGDHESATCGVLEEVGGTSELLSYQDKYQGNAKGKASQGMASAKRQIPAKISKKLEKEIQELALKTFKVLSSSGVCRIDFLMNQETKEVYVNEINTIPGSLAFYLWEPLGVNFEELTNRLLQLAIKRQREREKMTFSYETNVLANLGKKGLKGSKHQ